MWLPKDDLKDPSTWSSPPLQGSLVLLRDIHDSILVKYDCKDTVSPQSQSGVRARVGRSQQDGDAQQQQTDLFFIRNLSGFMKPTTRGERTPPMLPPSPPITGSRTRSSADDSRLKTSIRPLRSRTVRSSCVNACSNAWSLRLRTQLYSQRWRT